jgi:hypothetical protein
VTDEDRRRRQEEQHAENVAALARLGGKVETLSAKLEAYADRSREEIKALFAKSKETAGKVEDIRVDYAPKDDFDAHKERNQMEHDAIIDKLNTIQWRVAAISGGISLAAFLAGLFVKAVFH